MQVFLNAFKNENHIETILYLLNVVLYVNCYRSQKNATT